MFAESDFGQSFWAFFFIITLGLWGIRRMLSKADPEGKINKAAVTGLAGFITRWFGK